MLVSSPSPCNLKHTHCTKTQSKACWLCPPDRFFSLGCLTVACSWCPLPVLQIGDVRLVNGRFECKPSLTTSSPSQASPQAGAPGAAKAAGGAGAAGEVPFDIHQQMAQLAILMVSDLGTMKGHLYKVQQYIVQESAV